MLGSSRCFLYCEMVTGQLVWSHRGRCLSWGLPILPRATKMNRGPTHPEPFPVMRSESLNDYRGEVCLYPGSFAHP